nr:unnamed protein product [Callosobruchus analis]
MVQDFKKALKKLCSGDLNINLARYLLTQHNTPHCTTEKAPAEILLGRRLNTLLDQVKPDFTKVIIDKQLKTLHAETPRSIEENESVYTRAYTPGAKWIPATVVEPIGPVSYRVSTPDGKVIRRHTDQLRPRLNREDQGTTETPEPVRWPAHLEVPRESSAVTPISQRESGEASTRKEPGSPPGTEQSRPQRIRRPPRRLEDFDVTIGSLSEGGGVSCPQCGNVGNSGTWEMHDEHSGIGESSAVPAVRRRVWGKTGYNNLQNLSRAIGRYEKSQEHISSSIKFELFGKQNIANVVDTARKRDIENFNEKVRENREILKRLIDAVVYLSKEECSFRGHDETSESDNKGNFKELIDFLKTYDQKLERFLSEATVFVGTSKSIQNDLIESISSVVKHKIQEELRSTAFFSWQIDETTDIACRSQLSVIFRYVIGGDIVERFVGFYDVSSGRNAETYNGIKEVRIFFSNLSGFSSFFSKSSKRSEVLNRIVDRRIPTNAPTRWNFSSRAVVTVESQRRKLIQFFFDDTDAVSSTEEEAADNPQRKKRKIYFNFECKRLHHKQIFAQIFDTIIVQLETRFADLSVLQFFDLVNCNNFSTFSKEFPNSLLDILIEQYPIFDHISLKNELSVLYSDKDLLGGAKCAKNMLLFIFNNNLKSCLPELYKLLSLVLSIPVTSASVERSFSALKRIKTYNRSKITQDRHQVYH